MGSLLDLRSKFNDINNDHREAIYKWMKETFPVMESFYRDSAAFDELCQDGFWSKTRKKPNKKAKSRFILYYITEAKTKDAREKASRKALILRMLLKQKQRADEIAEVIATLGGISKAYDEAKAFFGAKKPGLASKPNSPRSSADDDDINGDDSDYEGAGLVIKILDNDEGRQSAKPNTRFPAELKILASENHSNRLLSAKSAKIAVSITGSSEWKNIFIKKVIACTK